MPTQVTSGLGNSEAIVASLRRVPKQRWRARLGAVLAVALIANVLGQIPSAPAQAAAFQPLKPQHERSVPGTTFTLSRKQPMADPAAAAALRAPLPAPAYPSAEAVIADPANGSIKPATPATKAGTSRPPVRVKRPAKQVTGADLPATARVQILDRAIAQKAQRPLLFRVGRGDGSNRAGRVAVTVDYSAFRTAYGADWASRLRLAQLPECALRTPEAAACQPTAIATSNDIHTGTLSADVALPATSTAQTTTSRQAALTAPAATSAQATSLLTLTSGPSGPTGDFTATPLSASSTWQAGGSSGDFSWSYPMAVPPSLGGPAPTVSLDYSSQSVDGRSAASNSQPSWIGEGFSDQPESISRSYKSCADDMASDANNSTKTGDLCWATDNAVLSLAGHSGELLADGTPGHYRLKDDDGTRVERLTGAINGDDDGEYWKITTTDGTQYYFGLNRLTGWTSNKPTTNSTWTVPVFGNNPSEPCNKSTFAASWCMQAWQWNLDYVVDTHGNTMSYWYTPETNNYARNLTSTSVSSYTRGGYLNRIDYGTDNRSGTDTDYTSANSPMRVVFTPADRCIPGSTCDTAHPTSWPDTPWDQSCTSSTSCTQFSPTFWTQKRLASVKTQTWDGTSHDIDQWTLTQTYPDPGDATRAGLWLAGISHTGLVGGTKALPDITFVGQQMPNRVNTTDSKAPPMNWWRISYINTESGGIIGVTYKSPDCVWGSTMPTAPDSNARRCYPVYWTRDGQNSPTIDWFQKYVVNEVTETDGAVKIASPRVITHYDYPNPPAWHYTTANGVGVASRMTWDDWRGYDQVNTTVGDPGEQTFTVTRFFRGMNGDHLADGTHRSVTVDGIADDDAYAGMTRETITKNGPSGAEVGGTVYIPWESSPTATRSTQGITTYARHTGTAVVKTRTDLDGGRGLRTSTVTSTYDNTYGYVTKIADAGDDAISTDDRCTVSTKVNNTSAWIIGAEIRSEQYAVPCGTTPSSDKQVISDVKTYYDGQAAYGATPTKGDVTQTDILIAWASPTNVTYHVAATKTQFDSYGRVTDSWDIRGNDTTTTYTPATGGPVKSQTTKNALGWTTTVDFDGTRGLPIDVIDQNGRRSDASYDPLGRLTAAWKPNRSKSANQPANVTYSYNLINNGPSSVTTQALNAAGNYISSYQLFDGLLRPIQQQTLNATGAGRVLTNTFYDTAGRVSRTYANVANSSAPGTSFFAPDENQVPTQTVNIYDGAGRVTASVLRSNSVDQWRTTTAYGGDRIDVTPPSGGTATSTYTNARGQMTALRQYHGPTPAPTGPADGYDLTTFGYDLRGNNTSRSDAAGNTWTTTYDLLGRATSSTDPDTGSSSTSYYGDTTDVKTTTDGRQQTLAYQYDTIGRKIAEYDTATTGTKLAAWTYDTTLMSDGVTLAKGYASSSSRYDAQGNAYTSTVRSYTDTYQQSGVNIVIPASEKRFPGTYIFTDTYNVDGSVSTHRYSPGGGLPAETVTNGYDTVTGLPTTLKTNYGGTTSTYVTDIKYTDFGESTVTTMSSGGKLMQRGLYYEEATRRLKEIVTVKETAPSTVSDVNYKYDPAGNITKTADTPTGGVSDYQCAAYDYLRRLTSAWTPASGDCSAPPAVSALGGPAPYWQSWTFDATGNRTTQTSHTAAGDVLDTYTYPAAQAAHPHAVQTVTHSGGGTSGTDTYTYDGAGNTKTRPGSGGTQTLTWNQEGDLAAVTGTGVNSSNLYDTGRQRLVSHDAAGDTLYLPGMELRYTTATNTVTATRYYSHGGNTVAFRTTSGLTWQSADNHGTGQATIADTAAQAVTKRRMDPYGTVRGSNPGWATPHGFVDGVNDSTGLTKIGARDYDPSIGRFISVDPVQDPFDPQQWNGYAYANNNPVTLSDPSGLVPHDPDLDDQFGHEKEGTGKYTHRAPRHPLYGEGPSKATSSKNHGSRPLVAVSSHVYLHEDDPALPTMRTAYQYAYNRYGKGLLASGEGDLWLFACVMFAAQCPAAFVDALTDSGTVGGPSGWDRLTKNDDGNRGSIIVGSGTRNGGADGKGYLRSLRDPESMEGVTEDELRRMVPDQWEELPTAKGDGVRWVSPKQGKFGQIRYLRGGMPGTHEPIHQGGDYLDVRLGGLQYRVAAAGNSVIGNPNIPSVDVAGRGPIGRLYPGGEAGEGITDLPVPEVP